MVEKQCMDNPAIFDLKWCPRAINGDAFLGQAAHNGELQLYRTERAGNEEDFPVLHKKGSTPGYEEGETPPNGLSLDWNNRVVCAPEPMVAMSQSDGMLSLFQLSDESQDGFTKVRSWKAHEFETWIAAFDNWNPNLVYSGADDALLKGWDVRAPVAPAFINRSHEAGVCTVHSHPTREHVLATGSYDEKLRIWDTRAMRRQPLHEENLGGGVWRLKWHPSADLPSHLLAACMHNGFHVVKVGLTEALGGQSAEAGAKVVASYHDHESLAYGSDWCYDDMNRGLVVSCSFYDNALHMWRTEATKSEQ